MAQAVAFLRLFLAPLHVSHRHNEFIDAALAAAHPSGSNEMVCVDALVSI